MSERSVLVVDDEDDLREVIQMSLEMVAGWDVVTCPDGETAVGVAATNQPDLILLDVMMPGMDGPATLHELRAGASTKEIPVIFLTAKVQRTDVLDLHQLGARGIIAKPFDPMSLPTQIDQLLEAAP